MALPRARSTGERALSPATEKSGRRLLDRWRLKSPSGAAVVSLRQLNTRERLRVTAPSMFTTGNMACGFSAILLAFGDKFTWAAALLAGSIVLDIADGAVARLVGATSPFGVQLDSLADLVSFGVAPAVLVHTWALPENPVLAWLSAFFWLACAAFRLARFNVTVDPLADKKYFVGLPSPGATLVVIATILALRTPEHGPGMLVPVGVSVVPGAADDHHRALPVLPRAALPQDQPGARHHHRPGGSPWSSGWCWTRRRPVSWSPAPTCSRRRSACVTAPVRARVFGPQAVAPPRQRMQSVFLPITDDED